MKLKQYEKFWGCKWLFFILVFFFMILLGSCNIKMIKTYVRVDTVVIKDGVVSAFIDNDVLAVLYKNNFCYINNKKIKVKLEKVNLRMFRQKKKEYHQVILSFVTSKHYVTNDSVSLFFFQENISFFTLFFQIWKGD